MYDYLLAKAGGLMILNLLLSDIGMDQWKMISVIFALRIFPVLNKSNKYIRLL